jgi:dTDP-glucose pyrophosphorylase
MTADALAAVTAPRTATIRDVLERIDRSGHAVALLVDDGGRLVGLLTDGDVRRAVLSGAGLDEAAQPFSTATPHTVAAGSSRALVLDLMRALRITAVPEVDADGRLVGLHTLSDVVGARPLPNPAVIMAGGRGRRLGDLTRTTPKPMLEVAGRSILEWIVLNLVGGGIRDISVSVNHFADQIEAHLGDGHRLGCRVDYVREDADRPLGTAGSLARFRAGRPDLEQPALVMNGDLMVQFEPGRLLEFHERSGAALTVATRPYQYEVPFGVVECDGPGSAVRAVKEKPTYSMDVNAGVYAVSPQVLDAMEPDMPCDMPDLIQACLDRGWPVHAWALSADWIDVGTPSDLARAKGHA